jgi:hypothetical protein
MFDAGAAAKSVTRAAQGRKTVLFNGRFIARALPFATWR